jgi:hypothetical protein
VVLSCLHAASAPPFWFRVWCCEPSVPGWLPFPPVRVCAPFVYHAPAVLVPLCMGCVRLQRSQGQDSGSVYQQPQGVQEHIKCPRAVQEEGGLGLRVAQDLAPTRSSNVSFCAQFATFRLSYCKLQYTIRPGKLFTCELGKMEGSPKGGECSSTVPFLPWYVVRTPPLRGVAL